MKTKVRTNSRRTHRIAPLIFLAPLMGLLLAGDSAAAADRAREALCRPCKATSLLALHAANSEAASDYSLDLAKSSTLPVAKDRTDDRKEALRILRETRTEARGQYKARVDLCMKLAEGYYHPVINPDNFLTPEQTAANPNPFLPLIPGTTHRYQGQTDEGIEVIEVRVTRETVVILGVTCMVIEDTVWLDGELVEDTRDWFAQDKQGNVWYFGEISVDYENGQIATLDGSWKAGVEGAKPGIAMKGTPAVGQVYRQEFALGEAEDAAEVLALNESVTVPFGTFANSLKTGEFTPLSPDSYENKFYARGVGLVLEVNPETGKRVELIAVEKQ